MLIRSSGQQTLILPLFIAAVALPFRNPFPVSSSALTHLLPRWFTTASQPATSPSTVRVIISAFPILGLLSSPPMQDISPQQVRPPFRFVYRSSAPHFHSLRCLRSMLQLFPSYIFPQTHPWDCPQVNGSIFFFRPAFLRVA